MKPATHNIEIYRGDTYTKFIRIRSKDENGDPGPYVDLTGGTPKAQIRLNEDAVDVEAEFTATLGNQTTFPGSIHLSLTPTQTRGLDPVNHVWDMEVTHADSSVRTYLKGSVTVIKEVTRP